MIINKHLVMQSTHEIAKVTNRHSVRFGSATRTQNFEREVFFLLFFEFPIVFVCKTSRL